MAIKDKRTIPKPARSTASVSLIANVSQFALMSTFCKFSRLIKDGKLLLTRIVRKQTMSFDVLDSHGDSASVAVDCLAPELTPRPLYGILCNDLFVLCRDPSNGQDANSTVDLWAVLRMQTMPQPASIVHEKCECPPSGSSSTRSLIFVVFSVAHC